VPHRRRARAVLSTVCPLTAMPAWRCRMRVYGMFGAHFLALEVMNADEQGIID
jgi:hypothetical protein